MGGGSVRHTIQLLKAFQGVVELTSVHEEVASMDDLVEATPEETQKALLGF